jgi:hypothetical protein
MTTPNSCRKFIIGLPKSGKTTFLAALWHVVTSGEVPNSLRLSKLLGNQSYLTSISTLWADAKPIPRTSIGNETIVTMLLKDQNERNQYELSFPDLSGETFELLWSDRQIPATHAEMFTNADGGIIMINPDHLITETLISETDKSVANLDQAVPMQNKANHELAQEWDGKTTPTQVKIVDILQSIISIKSAKPLSIAIIISAWDRVMKIDKTKILPHEWIQLNMPLLKQYIDGNQHRFSTKIYGVSAQGDSLDKANELCKHIRASDRLIVVDDVNNRTNDITLPIRWLINANN